MTFELLNQMKRTLGHVDTWLAKAIEHAKSKSFDPDVLMSARLAPDQFALSRQVQISCDTLKLGASRLSGKAAPNHADNEQNLDELRERIRSTLAYLDTFSAEDFAESATRKITQPRWEGKFMLGSDYLLEHVMPNFHFHAVHVYALLRHNGVPLGKMDYLNLNLRSALSLPCQRRRATHGSRSRARRSLVLQRTQQPAHRGRQALFGRGVEVVASGVEREERDLDLAVSKLPHRRAQLARGRVSLSCDERHAAHTSALELSDRGGPRRVDDHQPIEATGLVQQHAERRGAAERVADQGHRRAREPLPGLSAQRGHRLIELTRHADRSARPHKAAPLTGVVSIGTQQPPCLARR